MRYLICVILCSTSLLAQDPIRQGTWSLTGSLQVTDEDTDLASFKMQRTIAAAVPSTEFFLSDRVSIGLAVDFQYKKTKTRDMPVSQRIVRTRDKSWMLLPNVRLYNPLAKRLYWWTELSAGFGLGDRTVSLDSEAPFSAFKSKTDLAAQSARLRAGLRISVSERFGIESSFGVAEYNRTETSAKIIETEFRFSSSLKSIRLGLVLFL